MIWARISSEMAIYQQLRRAANFRIADFPSKSPSAGMALESSSVTEEGGYLWLKAPYEFALRQNRRGSLDAELC